MPHTYDQTFPLDGRMDLDILFGEKTMKTAVYIKMDAHDPLLSEGMCRLEQAKRHDTLEQLRNKRIRMMLLFQWFECDCYSLFVSHLHAAHLLIENCNLKSGSLLLKNDPKVEKIIGIQVEDALMKLTHQGFAQSMVSNLSGFTQSIGKGFVLGEAVTVTVILLVEEFPEKSISEAAVDAGARTEHKGLADFESIRR